MIEWLMDRYRGTNGLLGWLVMRADVRWLRNVAAVAKQLGHTPQQRR